MTPEEKQQLNELVQFKNQMMSSSLIPLGVDQAFRKRFGVPIILRRTLAFGNSSSQTSSEISFDVPQAEVGDLVVVTPPPSAVVGNVGGLFMGYVSSTGVVKIRFINADTSSAQDPGDADFTVAIFKANTK